MIKKSKSKKVALKLNEFFNYTGCYNIAVVIPSSNY